MKKNLILLVLLLFASMLAFRNCKLSRELESKDNQITQKTDTVYLEKPFKPEKEYSSTLEPNRILVYVNNASDTLFSSNSSKDSIPISNQDSLVQVLFKKDKLTLSLLNQETNTYSTRIFDVNLEQYSYNWYNGQLTKKKTSRLTLKPYIYGQYRPFNNLIDIGTGLSFKTKHFNYNLGVNAFYYPTIRSKIGTDLEFRVTYNF